MEKLIHKQNKRPNKIFKFSLVFIISILLILTIANVLWKNSGSNEWKFYSEKNGIKIWTLKTPGSTLLKVKGIMRVKSSLSSVVFFLSDTTSGHDVGALDISRIEQIATPPAFFAYDTYKIKLPSPFGIRDVVILDHYFQDSITKKVELNILAAPNKIPLKKNSPRMTYLNDIWYLTPLPNGEVEIEGIMDMDLMIPHFLANAAMPHEAEKSLNIMRDLLKTEKYKNRKCPFIKELIEI